MLGVWLKSTGIFLAAFFGVLSIPFIVFALLVLLPPRRNSDPESHGRLYSPLPTTVRVLFFYRAKNSALSSLVDSRRIVPTHALVGALDSWCLLRMKNSTRRIHDINTSRV